MLDHGFPLTRERERERFRNGHMTIQNSMMTLKKTKIELP